jgi:hypothetical protein
MVGTYRSIAIARDLHSCCSTNGYSQYSGYIARHLHKPISAVAAQFGSAEVGPDDYARH